MAADRSTSSEDQSSRCAKQRRRCHWLHCPMHPFSAWFAKNSNGAEATCRRAATVQTSAAEVFECETRGRKEQAAARNAFLTRRQMHASKPTVGSNYSIT